MQSPPATRRVWVLEPLTRDYTETVNAGGLVRVIILCITQLALACSAAPQVANISKPGLFIIDRAYNVKQQSERDGVVEYDVKSEFPATETIRDLTERLKVQGWVPVQPDSQYTYTGPGHPAAHELGWRTYFDGATRVLTWTRAWRNSAGDNVEYNLTYRTSDRDPLHPPGDSTLHVFAYRTKGSK